ncbi:MAG: hypothetical protein HFG49_06870 [Lachnospiraceae bacterium]|nr:hypothetical protein [Lachnospiraceae bacterium]
MRTCKIIFSVLTILFSALGMMKLLSYDIALAVAFVSMGLLMLVSAKECYETGSNRDALIFVGVTVFIYIITAYNLISRML